MGGGAYKEETYEQEKSVRKLNNISDFAYSDSNPDRIHPDLDPVRINGKVAGRYESRDSVEHPNSTPVVISFDVTGSNVDRARIVQQKLTKLMNGLKGAIPDPQVAVWANDDWLADKARRVRGALQMSEFESDNRVDEWLRKIMLVGDGGGNGRESYDLVLYAAARKTVLDCVEKRGRKGYLFVYADENLPDYATKDQIKDVFGDALPAERISIQSLIAEAREFYNIYWLWPQGGQIQARDKAVQLLGKEYVVEMESPDDIVETIISRVQIDAEKEAALTSAMTVSAD